MRIMYDNDCQTQTAPLRWCNLKQKARTKTIVGVLDEFYRSRGNKAVNSLLDETDNFMIKTIEQNNRSIVIELKWQQLRTTFLFSLLHSTC